MAAYLFVQIKMTSGKGWPEYRAAVDSLAEKFGGRYIVRGAVEIEVLEGTHDGRRLVVFEFPSMEAIHAFWHSPEYVAAKKLREGAADLDVWAVPGA